MTKKHFALASLGVIFLLGGALFITVPKAKAASLPTSVAISSTGPTAGSGIFNSTNQVVTPYYTVGVGGYPYSYLWLSVVVSANSGPFSITVQNAGAGCSTNLGGGVYGPDFGGATTSFILESPPSPTSNGWFKQVNGDNGCDHITIGAPAPSAGYGVLLPDGQHREFLFYAQLSASSSASMENAFRVVGSAGDVLTGMKGVTGNQVGFGYRDQDLSLGQQWGFDVVFGTNVSSSCSSAATSVTEQMKWADADPQNTSWNDNMVFRLWRQSRNLNPNSGSWINMATYSQRAGQISTNGAFPWTTFTSDNRYMVTFENMGTRNTLRVLMPTGLSQIGGYLNPPPCQQLCPNGQPVPASGVCPQPGVSSCVIDASGPITNVPAGTPLTFTVTANNQSGANWNDNFNPANWIAYLSGTGMPASLVYGRNEPGARQVPGFPVVPAINNGTSQTDGPYGPTSTGPPFTAFTGAPGTYTYTYGLYHYISATNIPTIASCSLTVTVITPPPPPDSIIISNQSFGCKSVNANVSWQSGRSAPITITVTINNFGSYTGGLPVDPFTNPAFASLPINLPSYSVTISASDPAGTYPPASPRSGSFGPCLSHSCVPASGIDVEPNDPTNINNLGGFTVNNSTNRASQFSINTNVTGASVAYPNPDSFSAGSVTHLVVPTGPITAAGPITISSTLSYGGSQIDSCPSQTFNPKTRPYFKSFQGDITAGGAFKNADGSCNPNSGNNYGAILGYARPTTSNGGRRGASTDFGAYALGLIHGSSSGPYGFYNSAANNASYNNLSFANNGSGLSQELRGGYMAGDATTRPSIGTNHCVTDYFDSTAKLLKPKYFTQNSIDASNLAPDPINNVSGQYFYRPPPGLSRVTITSVGPISGKTTIFVDGNVYISQNIVYGGWNPTDTTNAPYLTIIAKGNITVAPSVRQLDGLYIAQNGGTSPGAGPGIFATCASSSNPSQPAPAAEIGANCHQQLVVNGAVIAQKVMLLRSNGTLSQAPAGDNAETASSPNIAEVFNYMPSMILVQPNWQAASGGAITPGLLQGLFSLPPVF